MNAAAVALLLWGTSSGGEARVEAGAAKPLGAAVAPSTSFHSRLPEAEIATTAPSPIGFVGSHEPSFSRTELLKGA